MKLKSVSVLFSQQAGRARAGTEEGIQLSASAALRGAEKERGEKGILQNKSSIFSECFAFTSTDDP